MPTRIRVMYATALVTAAALAAAHGHAQLRTAPSDGVSASAAGASPVTPRR